MFDRLFVCGFAPWICGLIGYLLIGERIDRVEVRQLQSFLTIFFVASSLLVGESHQFTSIIRYYGAFRTRVKAYRAERIPLWIICTILAIGFTFMIVPDWIHPIDHLLIPPLSSIVLAGMILFPVVLMQHFCGQALAIGMTYCGLKGYHFTESEKTFLSVVSWCLVAAGATKIALPFGSDSIQLMEFGLLWIMGTYLNAATQKQIWSDRLVAWSTAGILFASISVLEGFKAGTMRHILLPYVPTFASICSLAPYVATGAVLFAVIHLLRKGFRNDEWLPEGAACLWGNLVLFILLVPLFRTSLMLAIWMLVPIFFHATQHWALAWHVRTKENPSKQLLTDIRKQAMEFFKFVLPVQAVSITILFLPLIQKQLAGDESVDTLPLIFSLFVFYFHYFADRVVWRPRS